MELKIENQKELIIDYCKECKKSAEEAEEIYKRLSADSEALNELCFYIQNKEFPSAGVILRVRTISALQLYKDEALSLKNPLEAYLLLLDLRKNPEEAWPKYYNTTTQYYKERNKQRAEVQRGMLEIIHKIATSGILKNPYVEGYFTRDYACHNLCCPSEEYLSSDWETKITISEDFEEFIKKCEDIEFKYKNHIVGYIGEEKVSITIECDKKDFNLY